MRSIRTASEFAAANMTDGMSWNDYSGYLEFYFADLVPC